MTIKEFYANGYQLIKRQPIIRTSEIQLNDDFNVDHVLPDAFPADQEPSFMIIHEDINSPISDMDGNPLEFDNVTAAIEFIKGLN